MTLPVHRPSDDAEIALAAVDLVVGVVAATVTVADAVVRGLRLPRLLALGGRPLIRLGGAWRRRVLVDVDVYLPTFIDVAMRRVRPTELVSRYVDIDALVAGVDLDAVAQRLDIEAIIARVDIDAIAERIDIEAILDRLDLTQTVLTRVDLKAVVDTVLTQMDLPTLVEGVLDEIDLPEIIRESTGTMASDTVRGVRMQGANADEAVSRIVDRLLLRRRRPTTDGTV